MRGLVAAAIVIVGLTTGCERGGKEMGAFPAAGSWRGLHLGVGSAKGAEELKAALPELAKAGINVVMVEVNYGFAYQSHPELATKSPVTKEQARALAAQCRRLGIALIPQFQCLGHQSWGSQNVPLLEKYPEFDETPGQFPKNEGIYCRSWCALNPKVNEIVFALFDELIDAFEAKALHVGMDEVFLIGSEHCPRCKGKNPAELYAKAVNDYHRHLVGERKVQMLMWGDRLIDSAEMYRYGNYEASENGTAGAIDRIAKDIIICDWHYGQHREYPSVRMFQEKGFRVLSAGWKDARATESLIRYAEEEKTERMLGHLCTTWGEAKIPEMARWGPVRAAMRKLNPNYRDEVAAEEKEPEAKAREFGAGEPGFAGGEKTLRINCGSTEDWRDGTGNVWRADRESTRGGWGRVGGASEKRDAGVKVKNTELQEVYHTEVYGVKGYRIACPNGKYAVTLHFAETYRKNAGDRIFNVSIEGKEVLGLFDPLVEAGGAWTAVTRRFEMEVKDGELRIDFTAEEEAPMVNGIEVEAIGD